MEKLYSCREVAEKYGVKVSTVWAWIREKKLSARRIGRLYRISEDSLNTFEKEVSK